MMGLGLICLLIAEERNKRSQKSTPPHLDEPSTRKEPRLFLEPAGALVPPDLPTNPINQSFDEEKWKSLVENDPDLSRLVTILGPYGQKYVVASARKDACKNVTSELIVWQVATEVTCQ